MDKAHSNNIHITHAQKNEAKLYFLLYDVKISNEVLHSRSEITFCNVLCFGHLLFFFNKQNTPCQDFM